MSVLIQKIIDELNEIPEEKLNQIYELIHNFRLDMSDEKSEFRRPGLLEGKLGKTFFEPLPEEELEQWETNI